MEGTTPSYISMPTELQWIKSGHGDACSRSDLEEIYRKAQADICCDGDAKSHKQVKDTYGADFQLEKLDCIGHVGKRMYRAVHSLRKASTKQVLKDGGKVGGKSGRLTAGPKGAVTRLSELDRNAIRKNVNRESADNGGAQKDQAIGKMQHSIQAVLYHSCKLTNNEERHRFCPPDDSCKFRSERKMD